MVGKVDLNRKGLFLSVVPWSPDSRERLGTDCRCGSWRETGLARKSEK